MSNVLTSSCCNAAQVAFSCSTSGFAATNGGNADTGAMINVTAGTGTCCDLVAPSPLALIRRPARQVQLRGGAMVRFSTSGLGSPSCCAVWTTPTFCRACEEHQCVLERRDPAGSSSSSPATIAVPALQAPTSRMTIVANVWTTLCSRSGSHPGAELLPSSRKLHLAQRVLCDGIPKAWFVCPMRRTVSRVDGANQQIALRAVRGEGHAV